MPSSSIIVSSGVVEKCSISSSSVVGSNGVGEE